MRMFQKGKRTTFLEHPAERPCDGNPVKSRIYQTAPYPFKRLEHFIRYYIFKKGLQTFQFQLFHHLFGFIIFNVKNRLF